MLEGPAHVHREHVGDASPPVGALEGLAAEALSSADLALDPHVGEEVHLELHGSVALAGLAPPASHVEAEAPRSVAPRPRLGQLGEEGADVVEDADVGRGVGAGRSADG